MNAPLQATPCAIPLSDDDYDIMAKTVWGEARGEGDAGMAAVAWVMRNRLETHYRRRQTMKDVCLDPLQFSCWRTADPNHNRMTSTDPKTMLDGRDPLYARALHICRWVMNGQIPNPVGACRHYFEKHMRIPPVWALNKMPYKIIGNHMFFEGIK